MAVKVYNEDVKKEAKPTYVRQHARPDGYAVCAVDEDGDDIYCLYVFDKYGIQRVHGAREAIAEEGHDTTFTKWDDEGRILLVM